MRVKKRHLVYSATVIVVIGLLIAGGMYFFGEKNPADPAEHIVAARFTRPNLVSYKQGSRSWSLKAQSIEEMPDRRDQIVRLIDITDGIVFKEGQPNLYFSADEGTWRKDSDQLLFSGNVLVIQENQRFTADTLTADMSKEEMHFVGNVRWESDTRTQIVAHEAVYRSENDTVEFRGAEDPVVMSQQE